MMTENAPETEMTNPFAGMQRLRLPGIHLVTAVQGGVPLDNALASFMFMMVHDRYEHACLIKAAREQRAERQAAAMRAAGSPEGMFIASLFGGGNSAILAFEEWSYLPEKETNTFLWVASVAAEQTQRWIFQGLQAPFEFAPGPIVERPAWADEFYSRFPGAGDEARAYVARLQAELVATE